MLLAADEIVDIIPATAFVTLVLQFSKGLTMLYTINDPTPAKELAFEPNVTNAEPNPTIPELMLGIFIPLSFSKLLTTLFNALNEPDISPTLPNNLKAVANVLKSFEIFPGNVRFVHFESESAKVPTPSAIFVKSGLTLGDT